MAVHALLHELDVHHELYHAVWLSYPELDPVETDLCLGC